MTNARTPVGDRLLIALARRLAPRSLSLGAAYYVAGLFGLMALTIASPLSTPRMVLFLAYVGLFFVVAWVVILLAFTVLAAGAFTAANRNVRHAYENVRRLMKSKPSGPVDPVSGVWDPWIDR